MFLATRIQALAKPQNAARFSRTKDDRMASSFNVRDAGAYEQLMGRWSKALAPQLIDFAGIAREQKSSTSAAGREA